MRRKPKYSTCSKHFMGIHCEESNCNQCLNSMCNCNCHKVEVDKLKIWYEGMSGY